MICTRCGANGIVFGQEAWCDNCRKKYWARMELLHGEARREYTARQNARARHPAGKSLQQLARQLWIDTTRHERSGAAEHKEECA